MLLFSLCICYGIKMYAAVSPHEQDIANTLKRTLKSGKVVQLIDDGDPILGVYTESMVRQMQGGVIILHELALNPESPDFVNLLRQYLPEHGWSTLAIKMPDIMFTPDLSMYRQLLPQTTRRISSAIKYLEDQNILNITVVGHGFGAVFAVDYLSKQKEGSPKALVIVGLPWQNTHISENEINESLAKIELPIFDIYGNRERNRVRIAAKNRKQAMRQHVNYRQLMIDEMDGRFVDSEFDLAKRIYSWMMRVSPGVQIRGSQ